MKKKYVMMGGLAFSESQDLAKLKKLAADGWLFDGINMYILAYRLVKGEPQAIDYAIDYQLNPDPDYFSIFKEAGWSHLLSLGEIHYFSAPEGTQPIYSEPATRLEQYQTLHDQFQKYSFIFTLILGLMIVITLWLHPTGLIQTLSGIVLFLTLIGWIFTTMPYFGYKYKLLKYKKN